MLCARGTAPLSPSAANATPRGPIEHDAHDRASEDVVAPAREHNPRTRPVSERQNGRRDHARLGRSSSCEGSAVRSQSALNVSPRRGRGLSTHDVVPRNDLEVAAFAWSHCDGRAPTQTLAPTLGECCRAGYWTSATRCREGENRQESRNIGFAPSLLAYRGRTLTPEGHTQQARRQS